MSLVQHAVLGRFQAKTRARAQSRWAEPVTPAPLCPLSFPFRYCLLGEKYWGHTSSAWEPHTTVLGVSARVLGDHAMPGTEPRGASTSSSSPAPMPLSTYPSPA